MRPTIEIDPGRWGLAPHGLKIGDVFQIPSALWPEHLFWYRVTSIKPERIGLERIDA